MMTAQQTKGATVGHASAMPAPTWHFLKMNDARIEFAEGLDIVADVKESVPVEARGAEDAFERALDGAQMAWEAKHPAPTAEERAKLADYMAAEADATYGGTAQSGYQLAADEMEEARSLAVAFEHGIGAEAAAYLQSAAQKRIVIAPKAGQDVRAQVIVSAVPDALCAAAIDIVADKASTVNLSVVVDGARDADAPDAAADAGAPAGATATTLRVFAAEDARVNIVRTQTLPQGVTDIDDMGLFADARSRIEVRQTVLGAQSTFTGLAGDLRGDASQVGVSTRYLGRDAQAHDFNYILRHHGRKSVCNLDANGVLAGRSSKTLRGTIDLIRGSKGAEGSERESVLLVDEDVHNKTVPVILCNEDDVAGNHGATIGHIRDEQMFYLASRGLAPDAAERMFVSAMVEQAALDAPDEASRAAAIRLGDSVAPGFSGLFDEE